MDFNKNSVDANNSSSNTDAREEFKKSLARRREYYAGDPRFINVYNQLIQRGCDDESATMTALHFTTDWTTMEDVDIFFSKLDDVISRDLKLGKTPSLIGFACSLFGDLHIAEELSRTLSTSRKLKSPENIEANKLVEYWSKKCILTDEKGRVLDRIHNYEMVMTDPELNPHVLRLNEITGFREFDGHEMRDEDFTTLLDICEQCGLKRKSFDLDVVLHSVFAKNKYNPIKEKFDSLTWDGKARAASIFIDYLGVDDTPLNRKMTYIWLYAAVKRALEPGCKFDQVLIIQGPQGTGKSLMFDRLSFGMACNNPDISTKDGLQRMHRSWFVIWDELVSLGKKDSSEAKNFISECKDVFRAPYAKYPEDRIRHFVFCGTTNEDHFLKDYSGAVERRFWIMKASRSHKDNIVFKQFTNDVVEQVWAEVYAKYKKDLEAGFEFPLVLLGADYDEFVKVQREYKYQNVDDRFAHILDALSLDYPRKRNSYQTCTLLDRKYFCKISVEREDPNEYSECTDIGLLDVFPQSLIYDMLSGYKFTKKECRGICKAFADWYSDDWEYTKYNGEYCLVRKGSAIHIEAKSKSNNVFDL